MALFLHVPDQVLEEMHMSWMSDHEEDLQSITTLNSEGVI